MKPVKDKSSLDPVNYQKKKKKKLEKLSVQGNIV